MIFSKKYEFRWIYYCIILLKFVLLVNFNDLEWIKLLNLLINLRFLKSIIEVKTTNNNNTKIAFNLPLNNSINDIII